MKLHLTIILSLIYFLPLFSQDRLDMMKGFIAPNDQIYAFACITNYPNPSSSKNLGKNIPDSILTFKTVDLIMSNEKDVELVRANLNQSKLDSIWLLTELNVSYDNYAFITEMKDFDGIYPIFYATEQFDRAVSGIKNDDFDEKNGRIDFWKGLQVEELSNIKISIKPEIKKQIGGDQNSFILGFKVLNQVNDRALKLDPSSKFQNSSGTAEYEIFYPVCGVVGNNEYLIDYSVKNGVQRYELLPRNDRVSYYLRLDYAEQMTNHIDVISKYSSNSIVENSKSPTRLSSFGYSLPSDKENLTVRNMALMTVSTLIYQNDLKIKSKLAEENRNRELKPLYDKYGKPYVDAAISGEVIIGTHVDLLKEALVGWIQVGKSEYTGSYIVNFKYIISSDQRLRLWISKKTNKVTAVSYYNM